jgi:ATP phosphoribosyltransferase regulatory subunit
MVKGVPDLSKWKIYTPDGVQDILVDDCYQKRELEQKLRNLFRSCGFNEIEPPSIEFYDVFDSESSGIMQENMFKFFDQQGRILVLRPDITVPVARITATKYKDAVYPLRFSYIGNVYRYNDYGGGKQNEFTQAGVEILGVNTPESDAEVISIAVQALKTSGLESFQIDIGQVDFFNGLMEEAGLSEDDISQLRLLINRKDNVGLAGFLKRTEIREDLKQLILDLPGFFGSSDVIEKARSFNLNEKSKAALDNISRILEILDDYGHSQYISVDLGMLRELTYDTGVIFRGFTYGVGFPILTGSRYDKLTGEFGRDCPATGFTLGVNMVMMALQRQKILTEKPATDTFVHYHKEGRPAAFELCSVLRKQGLTVELDVSNMTTEEAVKYAAERNIGGIISILDEDNVRIHYIQSGETTSVKISELLKR